MLALLSRKDRYGFELVNRISRSIAMSEGTMYPLLKRLRDDGLLSTYLMESTEGPPRKYYRLTNAGRERYDDMRKEWMEFAQGVNEILEGKSRARDST